jgi:hypothetical protein
LTITPKNDILSFVFTDYKNYLPACLNHTFQEAIRQLLNHNKQKKQAVIMTMDQANDFVS